MNSYNSLFFRRRPRKHTDITKLRKWHIDTVPLIMGAMLLCCMLCSTACASIQTDIRYSGDAGAVREKSLESIEAGLVLQRIRYNAEQLKRIQTDIETLLQEPSTDSSYLARLYALSADAYLLQQRKLYLEERLAQNPAYYRLQAELGGLYFAAQDYRNALAAFDASLSFLPEVYQQLYGQQREQSLQLYTIDGTAVRQSSEKILQSSPLLLVDMAALTQDSTNALDFITGTVEWKPPLLADYLQKNGWYHPERDVLKDFASKKDAALFLWHLIVGNNETRLKKYTRYYTSKRRLPIPDVMMDGIYFDAIVGTVEEDVMPLADGKNFEPDKPVSGMEFYRWLLKADALR